MAPAPPSPPPLAGRAALVLAALGALALAGIWGATLGGAPATPPSEPPPRVVAPRPAAPAPVARPKRPWGAVDLRGRVVDETGRGVAEASVQVDLALGAAVRALRSLSADGEGAFALRLDELAGLDAADRALGRLRVSAWSPAHRLGTDDAPLPEEADAAVDVRVELTSGGSLAGRVVDLAGAPVEGARVRVVARAEPEGQGEEPDLLPGETRTDGDGRWRIGFRGVGAFDVEAVREGVGHAALLELRPDPLGPTELPPLVLEERATIEGRALHPDGSPAPRLGLAATRLLGAEGDGPAGGALAADGAESARATTDGDGFFRLVGLRPGLYGLRVDGLAGPATPEPVAAGARDVAVEVPRPRVLATVVGEEGAPLAGVPVSCHRLRPAAGEASDAWAPESATLDAARLARTGADGVAAFPVEPDGAYGVVAAVPGLAPAEAVARVPAGTWTAEARLALAPVRGTGELAVTLVDPSGAPVAPFWVSLRSPATGLVLDARRVEAGAAAVAVPAGTYALLARSVRSEDPLAPDFLLPAAAPEPVEVRASQATSVELAARLGGRVRVRFDSPGDVGAPLRIRAVPEDGAAPFELDFFVYGDDERTATTRSELRHGEANLSRTVLEPGGYLLEVRDADVPGDEGAAEALRLPVRVDPGRVSEVGMPL